MFLYVQGSAESDLEVWNGWNETRIINPKLFNKTAQAEFNKEEWTTKE